MRLGGKKTRAVKAGKIRRGQMITTAGCGAVVDLPRNSVIMAGIDFWKDTDEDVFRIQEDNLQQYLGVDFFVLPPANVEDAPRRNHGVPAFRFPQWMYCPTCNRLASERTFNFDGNPKCNRCKEYLVPSRFVIACENGHLDDFPYEWWVHRNEPCEKPELYILMSERSSGLESIVIWCKTCRKSRSMMGSFAKNALSNMEPGCTGRRPWLNDIDPNSCEKTMRTLQRGASNLYFSITASALSIPPWSRRIQIVLGKNWRTLGVLVNDRSTFETVVKALKIPEECNSTATEIWQEAVKKKQNQEAGVQKTWQDILEEEYKALSEGFTDDDGQFKTRAAEVPVFMAGYIEQVTKVLRLREVVALKGFKRITPDFDLQDPQTFTRLGSTFSNWLPGVELLGEGIFLTLSEERLIKWETRPEVIMRCSNLINRSEGSLFHKENLSPRYILMHSLAHLLIRQMIMQCGYGAAAIKERIYSTFVDEDNPLTMSGILIYTADTDSEGSLGGLVREGNPERLDNTFRHMLEEASWCSADPICIQSGGQGVDALNLAACHACTLLPETSCESRNCFLDRGLIIGTPETPSLGYFSDLLNR
mgnify:CR=1 FL=1